MEWLNQNAGAVQAIAVVVLVIVTWLYAKRTADIAEATRDSASQQARVAALMEKDLQEKIRPHLTFRLFGGDAHNPTGIIENKGPGLAFDVKVCCRYFPGQRAADIPCQNLLIPGGETTIQLRLESGEGHYDVEITCTDSVRFNEYMFLWGNDRKMKDSKTSRRRQ